MTRPTLGAVVIGRNEGDRLKACLNSLVPLCARVVYVDSGSGDDSVAFARGLGVTVVELDTATPFTAARARNAGFQALLAAGETDLVQFVDGDCTVLAGWLTAGTEALAADPGLGLVTGWRSEIHPMATVYNQMCQVEWRRPAGPITACGGDMMVRTEAFRQVGGFNPGVIAAEDDEFCLRLGEAGWKLIRLPVEMTRHDAAMTRFGQWWRRARRAGHGFAQLNRMHPPHFRREKLRVWVYGLVLPLIFLLGLFTWAWISLAVLGLYALSWWKTWRGLAGQPMAARQAALLTLAKLPNLLGMLTYYRRARKGEDMRIIEYK
ncbi:Glycosyltransferase, GT2 family [Paracoccus halophilus]|uniref:Glycosyl transferase n=1 Tax=Paracoccus halophilus TaxID=376733 RepID=A0A099F808_9RHOB|nr:glycosyltransferase family 2 protein [Paracoccus halophilus]KGJ06840.1 glycosyl transferase [Paracoccus halophilus]SFA41203.1 Glycosyltransferase, GT2 family [Paracoccus halophilus]